VVFLFVLNNCIWHFLSVIVLVEQLIHFDEVIIVSHENMLVFEPW